LPRSISNRVSRKDVRKMSLRVARPAVLALLLLALTGCRSPYYADQGALFGGLTGAGVGALVGNAVGSTGAGAAIGAGVGALSGAAVGGALDDVEARNQAMIAHQMAAAGQQVPAGAVSPNDVVQMTRAGVSPDLIANHVRANGTIGPLQAGDLVYLSQEGVSRDVIAAMQAPPVRQVAGPAVVGPPVVVERVAPAPVIVEEHYYAPRRYYHRHPRYCPPPHGVSWGVSVSH
jgi:hypothetical protein